MGRDFALSCGVFEMNLTKNGRLAALVLAISVGVSNVAHAALPAGAADAIEAYETDVLAAFGLMIAAGIAIFAVRKLGTKMGWL